MIRSVEDPSSKWKTWRVPGVSPKDKRVAEDEVALLESISTNSDKKFRSGEDDSRLRELLASLTISDFLHQENEPEGCVVLTINNPTLIEIGKLITKPDHLALVSRYLYSWLDAERLKIVPPTNDTYFSQRLRNELGKRLFTYYLLPWSQKPILNTRINLKQIIHEISVESVESFSSVKEISDKIYWVMPLNNQSD